MKKDGLSFGRRTEAFKGKNESEQTQQRLTVLSPCHWDL